MTDTVEALDGDPDWPVLRELNREGSEPCQRTRSHVPRHGTEMVRRVAGSRRRSGFSGARSAICSGPSVWQSNMARTTADRRQNDPDDADRTGQGYRNGDIAARGLEQLARAIALPVKNFAAAD